MKKIPQIVIDESGKQNGRGAYLKKDVTVIEKARKTKALERILEIEIPQEIFEKLIDITK